MHCGSCDHVWQRPEVPTSAFSLIVGSTWARARPAPGRWPSGGPVRALRFEVQLPTRFRAAVHHHHTTEQSGAVPAAATASARA